VAPPEPQPLPAPTMTTSDAPDDDPRAARVSAARAGWTRHLVDLGGRNTLLWYRDLPTGTLDLTTAHPGGVASMMAGRPTKLSDLVREPAAASEQASFLEAAGAQLSLEPRGNCVGAAALDERVAAERDQREDTCHNGEDRAVVAPGFTAWG